MAFNVAKAFARVFSAIVRGAGDLKRKLMKFPSGHLIGVAVISRDVKGEPFKKLVQGAKSTADEQARFMMELPGFVRYVARLEGRNRELIAKRPPIRLPASALRAPPQKTSAPAPAQKSRQPA